MAATPRNPILHAACGAMLVTASALAGDFCDVVFRDVAERAPIVALVEYHAPREQQPYLEVVEVVKGRTDTTQLALEGHGLEVYEPRQGDRFLLALTADRTLVHDVAGLSFCRPKNVLAIRRGKVRAIDRADWDGSGKAPPLERLLAELRED